MLSLEMVTNKHTSFFSQDIFQGFKHQGYNINIKNTQVGLGFRVYRMEVGENDLIHDFRPLNTMKTLIFMVSGCMAPHVVVKV